MIGGKSGGTIYQWTVGWHVSPHFAAFDHLVQRSSNGVRLMNACWLHDEPVAREIAAGNPALVASLHERDRKQSAHAARNNDLPAVSNWLEHPRKLYCHRDEKTH